MIATTKITAFGLGTFAAAAAFMSIGSAVANADVTEVAPSPQVTSRQALLIDDNALRSADYGEALAMASDHEYGNGVSIFTRDGDAARDFTARVNVGMVGVNVPIPVPIAYFTFGGWKRSGFGDLNQHGTDAFRFYTKTKTVTSRWPSHGVRDGASFVIPTMS